MKRFILAATLALLATPAAQAAVDCANANTQSDMNQCATEAAKAADAELNAVYKQIMDALKDDASHTAKLTAAEKAWVAFRDAECAYQTVGSEDGSIYPMLMAQCLETVTKARTATLKTYVACPDFSLACPAEPESK